MKTFCLFTDTVDYLGHEIRSTQMKLASYTIDETRGLKPPSSITELRSFLELGNVFQQPGQNFAHIAAPLNQRLKKDWSATYLTLSSKRFDAMETLKSALVAPPVLALPYFKGELTINTDACNIQVCFVLLQKQLNKTIKSICYWCRSLTGTE